MSIEENQTATRKGTIVSRRKEERKNNPSKEMINRTLEKSEMIGSTKENEKILRNAMLLPRKKKEKTIRSQE